MGQHIVSKLELFLLVIPTTFYPGQVPLKMFISNQKVSFFSHFSVYCPLVFYRLSSIRRQLMTTSSNKSTEGIPYRAFGLAFYWDSQKMVTSCWIVGTSEWFADCHIDLCSIRWFPQWIALVRWGREPGNHLLVPWPTSIRWMEGTNEQIAHQHTHKSCIIINFVSHTPVIAGLNEGTSDLCICFHYMPRWRVLVDYASGHTLVTTCWMQGTSE